MKASLSRLIGPLFAMATMMGIPAANAGVASLKPTPQEARQLPQFCRNWALGIKGPKQPRSHYKGEGYKHRHHYCMGLNELNRATKIVSDKQRKKFHLKRSIAQFNYVLQRWKKTDPYYRSALQYRSMAEMMLGLSK